MAQNTGKYLSWKFANERLNLAIDAKFPIEAIAICESLICDRLISFASGNGWRGKTDKLALGQIATAVGKICTARGDEVGASICRDAQLWMPKRNNVIHGIGKSAPGTAPKVSASEFLDHAIGVAEEGRQLLKRVKAWHQRKLREHHTAQKPDKP